jgi:hypothetical protein
MTTPKTFGVLGPLIHPEHYPVDSRIAASWSDYTAFLCRLLKERPERAELIDRFFFDPERLTMH